MMVRRRVAPTGRRSAASLSFPSAGMKSASFAIRFGNSSRSMSKTTSEEQNWIKLDLHIHTLDDPKDAVDYSAHQLLERARSLGFGVLAITLHDAVFDRKEVFVDAAAMGI